MCWFISLNVTMLRKQDDGGVVIAALADRFGVYLTGEFPSLRIMNWHCSCDYVLNDGKAISVAPFVEAVVEDETVKRIGVGWTWSGAMRPDAAMERLAVQEFVIRDQEASLEADIWYRLIDPDKRYF